MNRTGANAISIHGKPPKEIVRPAIAARELRSLFGRGEKLYNTGKLDPNALMAPGCCGPISLAARDIARNFGLKAEERRVMGTLTGRMPWHQLGPTIRTGDPDPVGTAERLGLTDMAHGLTTEPQLHVIVVLEDKWLLDPTIWQIAQMSPFDTADIGDILLAPIEPNPMSWCTVVFKERIMLYNEVPDTAESTWRGQVTAQEWFRQPIVEHLTEKYRDFNGSFDIKIAA